MKFEKHLRDIISKLIKEEYENGLLKEFVGSEMISLKQYFSLTDEEKINSLPEQYYWFIRDWIEEDDIDLELPTTKSDYTDSEGKDVEEEMQDIEMAEWLSRNNPEKYHEFGKYLLRKIENNELPINEAEYPAWSYFDSNPKIVKNQWLIHFTQDADSIAREGFKYGVDDMDKLGLTTHLGEFEKKYGGYNFAYLLKDFLRYGISVKGWGVQAFKYGEEAVLFRASGLQLWHYGDQEPQVIFYGNTANNIIPITKGDREDWAIRSKKTGQILFEHYELEKVVHWLVNNWDQYRKALN